MREPCSTFSARVLKVVPTSGCGARNFARSNGEPLAGLEHHRLMILQLRRCGSWVPADRPGCRAACAPRGSLCGSSGSAPVFPRACHGRSSGGPHRRRRAPVAEDGLGVGGGPRVATIFARRCERESVRFVSENDMEYDSRRVAVAVREWKI